MNAAREARSGCRQTRRALRAASQMADIVPDLNPGRQSLSSFAPGYDLPPLWGFESAAAPDFLTRPKLPDGLDATAANRGMLRVAANVCFPMPATFTFLTVGLGN